MNLVLRRDPSQRGLVTYGVLEGAGGPYQTLELPKVIPPMAAAVTTDASMKPGTASVTVYQPAGTMPRSCVPPGIYQLELHSSNDHPHTWALVNKLLGVYHSPADIPANFPYARSEILLHTGNTPLDTKGCILVGLERSSLFHPAGITESRRAFDALKAHLPWVEGHTVTILGEGATPP